MDADKDYIRQVITNLITNSIKYGKEGGETESRFFDIEDNILIEISDNGIGVSKEHLLVCSKDFIVLKKVVLANKEEQDLDLQL